MRFFIIALTLFLFSCKKDEPVSPVDFGNDYYPGKKGTYVIYHCDSTVYADLNNNTEHYTFQIKEVIDSFFTDNNGKNAIRISRFKKWLQYDTLSAVDTTWHIQDVWWGNVTASTVQIVEENNRIVKLSFPVETGKTWKGNAYNILGDWDFEYLEVDVPFSIGNLYFPKTLHVNQYNSANILIYHKKYDEKYAKGVGMIYKEIEDYTWKENNGTIMTGVIKFGYHYIMNITDYGTE